METASLSTTDVLEHIAAAERIIATVALEIAALEASGNWAADGAVSFNAWLRQHGRMTHGWGTQSGNTTAGSCVASPRSATPNARVCCPPIKSVSSATPARHGLEPILEEQQDALVEILAPLDTGDTQRACQRVELAR